MTTTLTATMQAVQRRARLDTVRDVLRDPRTRGGLALTLLIVLIAAVGPFAAPYAVDAYIAPPFSPPSVGSPLGTDFMGQDVMSRVLAGGWTVLWMSVVAAAVGVALGLLLGMVAGYARGWLGQLIMRVSDVWLALPTMIFILLFVAMLGSPPWLLVLLIGLGHVPQVVRVVQATTLDLAGREFVESSEAQGATTALIVRVHILPNILPTVMVEFGLRVVWSIAALASLSLIGHGVSAPAADWGLMINENRGGLVAQPLAILVPLVLIAVFAVGVNLLTDGVSRATGLSDPKGRE